MFYHKFTSISHVTIWTNGGRTDESRTFLMTRTMSGGLYHVNIWEAGSWMVLCNKVDCLIHFSPMRNHWPRWTVATRVSLMSDFMFYTVLCKKKLIVYTGAGSNKDQWYLIDKRDQKERNLNSCSRLIAVCVCLYRFYKLCLIIRELPFISSIAVKKQSKRRAKGNDWWNVKKYRPDNDVRSPLTINMVITLLYYTAIFYAPTVRLQIQCSV